MLYQQYLVLSSWPISSTLIISCYIKWFLFPFIYFDILEQFGQHDSDDGIVAYPIYRKIPTGAPPFPTHVHYFLSYRLFVPCLSSRPGLIYCCYESPVCAFRSPAENPAWFHTTTLTSALEARQARPPATLNSMGAQSLFSVCSTILLTFPRYVISHFYKLAHSICAHLRGHLNRRFCGK